MTQDHNPGTPGRSVRRLLPAAFALAVLFTAILAGCGKQAGPAPAAPTAGGGAGAPTRTDADLVYFPLEPGTIYTYRTPNGTETRMAIKAPEELTDLSGSRKVTGYPLVADEETLYLTQDKEWVMEVGDLGEGGTTVYKTAKPEFPLHPKVGQSWTKSFADEFEGAGTFVSTITGFEAVQTRAGTFENAAKVHVSFQGPDGAKDEWTEWYAPGIGRVKTSNGLELERIEMPQ